MNLLTKLSRYLGLSKPSIEETFTWKYIDLDPKLQQAIKDLYLANLEDNLEDYGFFRVLPINIPDILGHKVLGAGLVYCCAKYTVKYNHKDPVVGASTFALNIPLINCENSLTTLYKSNKAPQFYMFKNRITEVEKIANCKPITSYVLDRPVLFNTQILHAVENYSSEPRVAISLRFDTNPIEWL